MKEEREEKEEERGQGGRIPSSSEPLPLATARLGEASFAELSLFSTPDSSFASQTFDSSVISRQSDADNMPLALDFAVKGGSEQSSYFHSFPSSSPAMNGKETPARRDSQESDYVHHRVPALADDNEKLR